MSDKTPAEKLRLKPGMSAAIPHLPQNLETDLGVPEDVEIVSNPEGADFLLEFATTQTEAEERLVALQPHVGSKTAAWICYPKGSKASGYDLSRDTVAVFARTIGLVVIANVAIDAKWSALRVCPL